MDTFDEALAFGIEGEEEALRWLQSDNWHLIETRKIQMGSGRGPRLICWCKCRPRLPDFLGFNRLRSKVPCLNGVRTAWFEIKRKSMFSHSNRCKAYETGIDQVEYDDYRFIADATSLPVYLIFKQNNDGLYLCDLNTKPHHADKNMVYWRKEDLWLIQQSGIDTSATATFSSGKPATGMK